MKCLTISWIIFIHFVFENIQLVQPDYISESQSFIFDTLSKTFESCEVIEIILDYKQTWVSYLPYHISEVSSGSFIIKLTGKNVVYKRSKDVHRLNSENCVVAVIFIPEYTEHLTASLFQTLTPITEPIIRKDEDSFIFVCESTQDCDQLLSSSNFGNKIKYKIGISSYKESSGLRVRTVDLYQNYGNPIIIELDRNGANLFPDSTSNFNGKLFRISNPRSKTYFDIENEEKKGKRGLYKTWLDVMMEKFNFSSYVFESSLSGGSGKQLANGTWKGTVGDVMSGVADMGAFVGHTFNRDGLIGYSAPITYEWMFFITHKPRTYYTSTAIFRPLSPILWIGFIISVTFMGATLKLLLKSEWSLSSYVNYIFASFIEQDFDHYINLKRFPVRVLVIFWLMFALVFSTAYRGKLVSLIAFPSSSWVPSTYEDLAYSNFRVGLHVVGKGGAADSIFSSSSNPVFKILNSKMEFFSDPTHCMSEAIISDIACVLWKCHFEYGLHDGFTDKFGRSPFHTSLQSTYFLHDGFIWESRAVFSQHINRAAWALLETGITSYWLRSDHKIVTQMWFDKERNGNNTKSSIQSQIHKLIGYNEGPLKLSLVQFKGLLIVFFCGTILSLICFVLELRKFKNLYCLCYLNSKIQLLNVQ